MPTIQTLQVGKPMRRIALLLLGWLMLTCAGVLDFLIKPIDADTLLAAIAKALAGRWIWCALPTKAGCNV